MKMFKNPFGKKPLPSPPLVRGGGKRSRALLSLLGLLVGVGGGFLLLGYKPLPAWVVFVLAALAALIAWWQTRCIKTDIFSQFVGASHAGDSSTDGESLAGQAPTRGGCWKYWGWRLGAFLLAVIVGIAGQVAWWWAQDDQPLWRLGFVPLPTMVHVPTGKFSIGSDSGAADEKPIHAVTIKQPFRMSQHEITFAEYDYYVWLMDQNGIQVESPNDEKWGRDTRPVINVSWDDAQGYVNWLSKETGESCRLPTEAEWEYAARAGTTTDYPWGDKASHEYANYGKDECCDGLAEGKDQWVNTAPVGSFPANKFGLRDMHGNVWEWVQDCWHDNYTDAPSDGTAWESGGDCGRRVLRGGSWYRSPVNLRSSTRDGSTPDLRNLGNGFRVDCVLPSAER